MIARLSGVILKITDRHIYLRTDLGEGSIAYEIRKPVVPEAELEEGRYASFWIYHSFTQEEQVLFGFESFDARELAVKLLTVSGIGPVMAHRVATSAAVAITRSRIADADHKALAGAIKGLGPGGAKKLTDALQKEFHSSGDDPRLAPAVAALEKLGIRGDIADAVKYARANIELTTSQLVQGLVRRCRSQPHDGG